MAKGRSDGGVVRITHTATIRARVPGITVATFRRGVPGGRIRTGGIARGRRRGWGGGGGGGGGMLPPESAVGRLTGTGGRTVEPSAQAKAGEGPGA